MSLYCAYASHIFFLSGGCHVMFPITFKGFFPQLQPRTKPVETHYKNIYLSHSPRQKCLLSPIKRLFSPSPIAMLFAVTQEMHVKLLSQNNIAPGVGRWANLFLLDTMVAWREIENCIEMS